MAGLRMRPKSLVAILLALMMLITMSITALADGDYDGGDGGAGTGGDGAWTFGMQGYRISVIHVDTKATMHCQDVLFSAQPSYVNTEGNKNKVGATASGYILASSVGYGFSESQAPVSGSGTSFATNGSAFRAWAETNVAGTEEINLGKLLQKLFGDSVNTEIQNAAGKLRVVIEPVFWYIPRDTSGNLTAAGANYIYGTTKNLASIEASLFASSGNGMSNLSRNIGPKSLIIEMVESFPPYTPPSIAVAPTYLSYSQMQGTEGWGMHVYWPTGNEEIQRTKDTPLVPNPHPAPIWPPPGTTGPPPTSTTHPYFIVKYYVTKLPDGTEQQDGNYTRTLNPKTIRVEDEIEPDGSGYKLVDWHTYKNGLQTPVEKYENYKSSHSVVKSGTSPTVVIMEHPAVDNTVVLKLVREEPPDPPPPATGQIILRETQVTKSIDTDGNGTEATSNWRDGYPRPWYWNQLSLRGCSSDPCEHKCTGCVCVRTHTRYCSDDDCSGHSYSCGGSICHVCYGHSCSPTAMYDTDWSFWFKRVETPDASFEGTNSNGQFKPQLWKTNVAQNDPYTGNRSNLDSYFEGPFYFTYHSVIHRIGDDKVTIRKYNDPRGSAPANTFTTLKTGFSLTEKNVSDGARRHHVLGANANYNKFITITFDDASADRRTSSAHASHSPATCCVGSENIIRFATKPNGWPWSLSATVLIETYSGGSNHPRAGRQTTPGRQTWNMKIGSISVPAGQRSGEMFQFADEIRYNSYVRMSYQVVQAGTNTYNDYASRTPVAILSEYISKIQPNAYAEAGWYQGSGGGGSNQGVDALKIRSSQWSGAARATTGGGWRGANQVLPGGAVYTLDTGTGADPGTYGAHLHYGIATWQPIVPDPAGDTSLGQAFADAGTNVSQYSLTSAQQRHTEYRNSAIDAINKYRVVQWVQNGVAGPNAWSSPSAKIEKPNQDISILGGALRTNSDSKYMPKTAGAMGSIGAGEGDLDIISESTTDVYWRVSSDHNGNIRVVSGTSFSSVQSASYTAGTVVASRTQTTPSLSGDIAELEQKTQIISQFMASIERNNGFDPTAMNNTLYDNNVWYNETWPGVYVLHRTTDFTIGFDTFISSTNGPHIRSAALDPALCPPNEGGQSDMYNTANLSQFRVNRYPESAPGVPANVDEFIGTFGIPGMSGRTMIMPNIENSLQSKKFYIPNATVQDLK